MPSISFQEVYRLSSAASAGGQPQETSGNLRIRAFAVRTDPEKTSGNLRTSGFRAILARSSGPSRPRARRDLQLGTISPSFRARFFSWGQFPQREWRPNRVGGLSAGGSRVSFERGTVPSSQLGPDRRKGVVLVAEKARFEAAGALSNADATRLEGAGVVSGADRTRFEVAGVLSNADTARFEAVGALWR